MIHDDSGGRHKAWMMRGAVVHDAQRKYEHCAFQCYQAQRLTGELLWIGTSSDDALLDELLKEST
jgi:hypothetical protein